MDAFEIKENTISKKWNKVFPRKYVELEYLHDLAKFYCLAFTYEGGTVINLDNGNETELGTLPSKPLTFINGIIVFKNGTAYGVKGIFEDTYIKMLAQLIESKDNCYAKYCLIIYPPPGGCYKMPENLVKLWKKRLKGLITDYNGNIYLSGTDGIYRLDPCTGELELTNLIKLHRVYGKKVEVYKEGRKYSFEIEDKIGYLSYLSNRVKNAIYYDWKNKLKIYDVESGEKIFEMKQEKNYSYFFRSSPGSKYILIIADPERKKRKIFKKKDRKKVKGKIIIIDAEKGETYRTLETLGSDFSVLNTFSEGTEVFMELDGDASIGFADFNGVACSRYGMINIFVGLGDFLLEQAYHTPIEIFEDSSKGEWGKDKSVSRAFISFSFSKRKMFLGSYYVKFERYSKCDGKIDLIILNLDGEIILRSITPYDEIFAKLLPQEEFLTPFLPRIEFYGIYDKTVVCRSSEEQLHRLIAFELKKSSVEKMWEKYFPRDPQIAPWRDQRFLPDLVKPCCLTFNPNTFEGVVVNLKNGNEIRLGTLISEPVAFHNGIILFENGAAYGVKGIFEETYVKELERLLDIR
ncbi:MAG: hypothetical protein B6U95_02385 [Thermofilum sp. ex4484_82]|nr:MAG: hypothetical protein B6U95_02385 [Thermofilum sp. ex4484_82]OYT39303.1 MAG: hypothetical protein B6U96_02380 [Archaeoglobales archaeon ex4484_92]